jgi:glycosyltransferase involved in cell wall biosynthesis
MNARSGSCCCDTASVDTSDPRPLVSVVVPAYNEAAILAHSVDIICRYMQGLEDRYRWELLIVNDGSTDNTGEVAEQCAAAWPNVYVLHHPYNFRLGQALRYAFTNCRGDFVVVMDVDLSYSVDHIERMLTRIRETKAKIVIASPYMKGGAVRNVPAFRKFLSKWANWYLCLMVAKDGFSDRMTTITGMVRCYDREFLQRLNLKAMSVEINSEIIYKAMILRARIVEIPATLNWGKEKSKNTGKAQNRKSSMRTVLAIMHSFVSGFMFRPFLFFIFPGIFFTLVSFYPLGWAAVHSLSAFGQVPNASTSFLYRVSDAIGLSFQQAPHAFVVGGFCLLIGVQLFNLGLMALQNKRYFEEMYHLASNIYYMRLKDKTAGIQKVTKI